MEVTQLHGLQKSRPGQKALVLPQRHKKRWAPKSKTGCTSCRIRRVKCDETAPACRRCLSHGRHCEYLAPSQATEQTLSWRQNTYVTTEYLVMPPDWHFSEACRYFLRVVMPAREGDLDHDKIPYLPEVYNFPQKFKPVFIAGRVAEHITHVTRAENLLSQAAATPYINSLWDVYHSNALLTIQFVNQCLEDLTTANKLQAKLRITDICSIEMKLGVPSWRAHVTGFLALIHLLDGLDGTAPSWLHARATQFHITYGAIGNTISPAHRQIHRIYEFETEKLQNIYSFDLFNEMPCPTVLFLDIIRITRLRMASAAGASFESVIQPAAREIFEHVDSFSPEGWTEPYTVPEKPEFPLLAGIFKSAVTLYCILSLLPRESDAYQLTRPVIRDHLLGQMRQVLSLLTSNMGLAWPISVVAVALVDGAPEDKAMIEKLLFGGSPENYFHAPMAYIKRFREFWASGKTAWDDCYHVPFHPLA